MENINQESNNLKFINLHGVDSIVFQENREKFINNLNLLGKDLEKDSLLIFEGGKDIPRHDTDTCFYHFIQESYFYYLTGVQEPDFFMIFDLKSNKFTLFLNKVSERYKIFMTVLTDEEAAKKYNLDCFYSDTLIEFLKKRSPKKIFRLSGTNSDSGIVFKKFKFEENFKEINNEDLELVNNLLEDNCLIMEILSDTRVTKSLKELEIIKYTCEKTVDAHIEVMKNIRPGCLERDAENIFVNYMRTNHYTRELPYLPICGCCEGSATLHYEKNDSPTKDGDIILLDMGARLGGYCSDITITIPVNGKFTQKQKDIYNVVLKANRKVMKELKAGVTWSDMHLIAEKSILEDLQKLNILNNEFSFDEMIEKRIAYYFMPHGLGHLIGLDVHDVGGYLTFTNPRSDKLGLKSLRTNRKLVENIVLTVEPGVYFIKFLLEKAFADEDIKKYFNADLIRQEYFNFGGVRIEDVVLVYENGCKNFSERLPRTIEEIEEVMNKA
jgi:Xaa-Pro dipeptidase